jgi:hypothetical protein
MSVRETGDGGRRMFITAGIFSKRCQPLRGDAHGPALVLLVFLLVFNSGQINEVFQGFFALAQGLVLVGHI